MLRSFGEIRKRTEEFTRLISEAFGVDRVGRFAVSESEAPVRRKRKRRYVSRVSDTESTSDEFAPEYVESGIVKDIIIEAQDTRGGNAPRGAYLTTWEGYPDLECAWVLSSGMSTATKVWWELEREQVYPGYSVSDFPVYDSKSNVLRHSPASEIFIAMLPLSDEKICRVGNPWDIFMESLIEVDFDQWRFVHAAMDVKTFAEFFGESILRVPPVNDSLIEDSKSSSSDTLPRRKRLIVTSTTTDEESAVSDEKSLYSFKGQPAYLVREIRGERVVRGRLQYHVFWAGYDSCESTWEPASNVNSEAIRQWKAKRRKIK